MEDQKSSPRKIPRKRKAPSCPRCRNASGNKREGKKWVCGSCGTEFGFGKPRLKIELEGVETSPTPKRKRKRTHLRNPTLRRILDRWLEKRGVL
jgi:ribosomal protein L37AE/L43A